MLLDSLLGGPESLARKGPLSETPGVLYYGGQTSAAGPRVDEESALSLSGVFAAVHLLASVKAALPFKVYRQEGKRRVPATNHLVYRLLGKEANREATAFAHRYTREFHRLLWGNGYSEIQWAGNARATALWNVEPWRVKPERTDSGSLAYRIDGQRLVSPGDMLHTTLTSTDGVTGRSFVDYAIESLGLGMATQEFAARFFGNGARPGAVLTHPGTPSDTARKKFREGWEARHQGPSKAGGTAVLFGGWTYSNDGAFDPQKGQLIEQRRFTVEEVARWLNIPPHLLRDLSRATFSNIEQQNIDFVTYSIGPSLVQEEQEHDRKLLQPGPYYCKHNLAGLLRGDSAARSAFYRELFGIGVFSPNDVLELEDMDPVEGGDQRFVPANMMPLVKEEEGEEPAPQQPQPNPPTDQGQGQDQGPPSPPSPVAEGMRLVLAATLERLARVEANAVQRLAGKPNEFLAGVEAFYSKHQATLAEAVGPVLRAAYGMSLAVSHNGDAQAFAATWCEHRRSSLVELSGQATALTLASQVEAWAATGQATADHVARVSIEG